MTLQCVACAVKHVLGAKTSILELREKGVKVPVSPNEFDDVIDKLVNIHNPLIPTVNISTDGKKENFLKPKRLSKNIDSNLYKNPNNPNRSDSKMAKMLVKAAGLAAGALTPVLAEKYVDPALVPPVGTASQWVSYGLGGALTFIATRYRTKLGDNVADFLTMMGLNSIITKAVADIKGVIFGSPIAVRISVPRISQGVQEQLASRPEKMGVF